MSIKESALTAITTIANSDFVRAVTSAGASRKITVANLAKQIIEGYAGSTVAGSAQSVKSALDSLNSKIGNVYSSAIGISNNASVDIDLPSGSRGIMFTTGVAVAGRGIYAWGTSSSGVVSGSWLVQATGISVDMSTANTIKFTNTSGTYINVISFR